MTCKEFQNLSPQEQRTYIGSVVHACISDSEMFKTGERIIEEAGKLGLFDRVIINPGKPPEPEDPKHERFVG